jgi:hypothetical protein
MKHPSPLGMERLLDWLPAPGRPTPLRFAGATIIMFIVVIAQITLERATGLPGLSLLLAGVFVTAISYDHGTGFYAGAIAIIASYFSIAHLAPAPAPLGMIVFSLLCFGVAVFGEALRNALHRSTLAARTSEMLLEELQHRTKNTLGIIDALLTLQRKRVRAMMSNRRYSKPRRVCVFRPKRIGTLQSRTPGVWMLKNISLRYAACCRRRCRAFTRSASNVAAFIR